jgi:hypothetical protein
MKKAVPQNHQWLPHRMGAKLYADIRSVIETARRRAITALEAIRLTLAGKPLATAP